MPSAGMAGKLILGGGLLVLRRCPVARIEKDTVSYFPHDAKASTGDTLTILQGRFGNDGYAIWFKVLEKLAATDNHYIDLRSPVRWQLFTAYLRVNEITTVEIMELLVEIEAIDVDLWGSRIIWCQNLVNNLASVYKNRRREIPSKPLTTNGNTNTTGGNTRTIGRSTQSKVNKSKVNKSKVGATTNFLGFKVDTEWLHALAMEYKELDFELELTKCADYWSDSKHKLKSPKLAIRNWFANARKFVAEKAVKGDKTLPDTKTLKEAWNQ